MALGDSDFYYYEIINSSTLHRSRVIIDDLCAETLRGHCSQVKCVANGP